MIITTAKAEGNTLTATGFSNTMSQKIEVTYTTTTGEVYSDTAIVHFSDMKWEPTNHKPPSFMSSISESVVNEDAFMGVELYPNPAHTSFSIKLPEQLTPATIEIYDINGRLVKTMKVDNPLSSVDVSNWARGVYMVKISKW